MDASFFENLLNESESNYLDFKQEQYQFDNAPDEVKGELLKDILAFANAWRRTDAYILLGIKEVKGGRSEVLGITRHLDDASLQQFVNSKVQKPLSFSYIAYEFEGKQVGIIHISIQDRPFYLKLNYGRLKQKVVYLRRGSSTAAAEPDEIAKMGAFSTNAGQSLVPTIDCEFANPKTRKLYGKDIEVRSSVINIEDSITDFSPASSSFHLAFDVNSPNRNYYRDLYKFYAYHYMLKAVNLRLTNTGQVTAYNTRVEIAVTAIDVLFLPESDLPDFPRKYFNYLTSFNDKLNIPALKQINSRLAIKRYENSWLLSLNFGSIQPKAEEWLYEKILVGSRMQQDIQFEAVIFADNIPDPIRIPLGIQFHVENLPLKLSDLEKKYNALIKRESKQAGF